MKNTWSVYKYVVIIIPKFKDNNDKYGTAKVFNSENVKGIEAEIRRIERNTSVYDGYDRYNAANERFIVEIMQEPKTRNIENGGKYAGALCKISMLTSSLKFFCYINMASLVSLVRQSVTNYGVVQEPCMFGRNETNQLALMHTNMQEYSSIMEHKNARAEVLKQAVKKSEFKPGEFYQNTKGKVLYLGSVYKYTESVDARELTASDIVKYGAFKKPDEYHNYVRVLSKPQKFELMVPVRTVDEILKGCKGKNEVSLSEFLQLACRNLMHAKENNIRYYNYLINSRHLRKTLSTSMSKCEDRPLIPDTQFKQSLSQYILSEYEYRSGKGDGVGWLLKYEGLISTYPNADIQNIRSTAERIAKTVNNLGERRPWRESGGLRQYEMIRIL